MLFANCLGIMRIRHTCGALQNRPGCSLERVVVACCAPWPQRSQHRFCGFGKWGSLIQHGGVCVCVPLEKRVVRRAGHQVVPRLPRTIERHVCWPSSPCWCVRRQIWGACDQSSTQTIHVARQVFANGRLRGIGVRLPRSVGAFCEHTAHTTV